MKRKGWLGRARAGDPLPVARITTASPTLAEDVAQRMRRYLIQMSIRVVCLIGAVTLQHWSRWLLLLGAVVLPYIAVLLANAGRVRVEDPGTFLDQAALPAGPTPRPDPAAPNEGAP